MPMILLKLLGIGKWLKEAATALLGLIRRYPWQAALIAALCLAGWQYRGKQNALADLAAERLAHAETIKAGEQAYAAQVALNTKTKAAYEAAAKDADHEHDKQLALANDRTERFIRDHRVHQVGGSGAGGTSPAAEGEAAGVHQEMPTDAVLVGAADVRICTARSQDALSAYEFGQALIRAGVAE